MHYYHHSITCTYALIHIHCNDIINLSRNIRSASQLWPILHHCLTWGAFRLCCTTLLRKPSLELDGCASQVLSGPCSCIPWKYGKLRGKLRCPSFDKSGNYSFEMIGSTKLGEITTWFEGQQLNDVHLFSQLALQPLIMIYMLYIWTLPVLSLTQHSVVTQFSSIP